MSSAVAQPITFVAVGAGGFAINLSVFAAAYELGVAYRAASVAAFLVSSAFIYVGNRRFTFRLGRDNFWSAYVRSILVAGVVAAMSTAVLSVLVERAGADPRIGQALSLAALTPVAFVLNKRWTFALGPT